MKRVLLICYYFPPLGGAGVGRPLALFKHLPRCGFECDVLTIKPVAYRVFEPELLDGLDTSCIYRAGSYDPQRLLYLLGLRKVRDSVIRRGKKISERFFPDSKIGWLRPAIRLGRALLSNKRYGAVISTSPPISAHLVAQQLSSEYKTPWIADFRDYWTLHKAEEVFQRQRQIKRALGLLKRIRRQAAAITAVTASIAEYVNADEVIYNSYDIKLARLWQPPNFSNQYYIIGLLGTLNDLYPVEPLLKVVAAVRKKAPHLYNYIKLLQVGNVDINWLRPQLERYDLLDRCDIRLFQKRDDTISILSGASLFYLGLSSVKEKGVILGRTYTLLASGRPILAAVPPGGEMEKMIAQTGNGLCFTDDNVSNAVDYLCKQTALWESRALKITPLPDYARRYSSENMAKQFAHLLNQVLRP